MLIKFDNNLCTYNNFGGRGECAHECYGLSTSVRSDAERGCFVCSLALISRLPISFSIETTAQTLLYTIPSHMISPVHPIHVVTLYALPGIVLSQIYNL